VYVQEVLYGPQLRVAENGVIENYKSDTRKGTEKVDYDYVTAFTVNGSSIF
jgi:predicted glutamine amidotransferase